MHKIGLTLGKFAPFHKGHQLVVETALAEMDKVFVLIYDTDVISIPLSVRAKWIKALYPKVNVIEAFDGPEGYGDTPEIKKVQEDYIIKKLNGQRITHFYNSEFYGDHVSKALNAVDRRIDEARQIIPISGTKLRENRFENREYLDDVVYQDLIVRVCFMGAPSTGKSSLSKALADKFATRFMPEYGSEFWLNNQVDRRISLEQFEQIAPEHCKREDKLALISNRFLFCDTCPITTYVFAKDYHQKAGPILTEYAKKAEKRYDLFFLCDTDIPYDDTWDRSGEQKREWFQKQIIDDLRQRRIPYIPLSGSLEERIHKVELILSVYKKYDNILLINNLI